MAKSHTDLLLESNTQYARGEPIHKPGSTFMNGAWA